MENQSPGALKMKTMELKKSATAIKGKETLTGTLREAIEAATSCIGKLEIH